MVGLNGYTLRLSDCIACIAPRARKFMLGTALTLAVGSSAANAAEANIELAGLSLSQLMDVRVSSVTLRLQDRESAPAAVTVLTNEDIRRSGAENIPDLLRLVPGVHVGQITPSTWSITARGFGGRFARKLLVLVDGRTVYQNAFSGTFWDTQDLLLEDVERIEVIRGPGASIWGTNAVNGVINIITKDASETTGAFFTVAAGTDQNFGMAARYGAQLSENTYLRVYGKFDDYDARSEVHGEAEHGQWDAARGGFRLDSDFGNQNRIELHGSYYSNNLSAHVITPILAPPFMQEDSFDGFSRGFSLAATWEKSWAKSALKISGYVAEDEREELQANLSETVYDIGAQHTLEVTENSHLISGLGYRHYADRIESLNGIITLDPNATCNYLLSGFVQYDAGLFENTLNVVFGLRVEDHERAGTEFLPNARLAWMPMAGSTLWGAVSRAARSVSPADQTLMLTQTVIPPMPPTFLPTAVQLKGNKDIQPEKVTSYEFGFRQVLTENLSIEASVFHNNYDHLYYQTVGDPTVAMEPPHLVLPVSIASGVEARTQGIELAANWFATDWLQFSGGYSYFDLETIFVPADSFGLISSGSGDATPAHMVTLNTRMNPFDNVEFDATLRHVGQITQINIDSYTALDLRLAWRPTDTIEVSLIGRNLFADAHEEYRSEFLGAIETLVPTSAVARLIWRN